MELIYDTNIDVKGAAIRLVFKISNLYSPECVRNRLVNLFLELIASHNEELTKRVSFILGEMLQKLETFINKSSSFLIAANKGFKAYALHKNDDIRKNFAKNIIPIIKILDPKNFIENFKINYISMLIHDKNKEIRLICLDNFPKMLKLIGFELSHRHFEACLMKLIKDDDKEILKKLLFFFNDILQNFVISDPLIVFEDMNNVIIFIY